MHIHAPSKRERDHIIVALLVRLLGVDKKAHCFNPYIPQHKNLVTTWL